MTNPFKVTDLAWPVIFKFHTPEEGTAEVRFLSRERIYVIVPGLGTEKTFRAAIYQSLTPTNAYKWLDKAISCQLDTEDSK